MITIGIPTYNRKDLLEIMSKSLYQSDLSIPHNIRIYDDCSTEYGEETLKELFPDAQSIIINNTNLKADRNIYSMYKDFLFSEDDFFFNADSDLIFNKDWLRKATELINETDGILSIFNSNTHDVYQLINNELCLKKDIGSAGTIFSRNRLEELLMHFNQIEEIKGLDWQFSEYFKNNNVRIFCVNQSLIQHIGYRGQNSSFFFDYGRNFKIESIDEGQIINDIYESHMDNIRIIALNNEIKDNELKNNFIYHFKRCIIIFIKSVLTKNVYSLFKKKYIKIKNGFMEKA